VNIKTLIISTCLVAASLNGAIAQTNNTDQAIPSIRMSNVPLTFAIDNFARQAGINFILDPKLSYGVGETILDPSGKPVPEPIVTIYWQNTSVNEALNRLLKEYHLVMVTDRVTSVARISYPNRPVAPVDASLLNAATNTVLPVIEFEFTPLDVALDTLIQQAGVNVALDPKWSNTVTQLPTVSLRWQNMTARQAIIAICENYNLAIVKDPVTGAIQIKPNK
jgi:hypothetical protein